MNYELPQPEVYVWSEDEAETGWKQWDMAVKINDGSAARGSNGFNPTGVSGNHRTTRPVVSPAPSPFYKWSD